MSDLFSESFSNLTSLISFPIENLLFLAQILLCEIYLVPNLFETF